MREFSISLSLPFTTNSETRDFRDGLYSSLHFTHIAPWMSTTPVDWWNFTSRFPLGWSFIFNVLQVFLSSQHSVSERSSLCAVINLPIRSWVVLNLMLVTWDRCPSLESVYIVSSVSTWSIFVFQSLAFDPLRPCAAEPMVVPGPVMVRCLDYPSRSPGSLTHIQSFVAQRGSYSKICHYRSLQNLCADRREPSQNTCIHTDRQTYRHTYMFVVVNFDALTQASDIRIEGRRVVILWWMQDSNPRSQTPNRQQTECLLTNQRSYHQGSS